MKQLTQYIQEKLQIKKDSKVKNSLLENIYSFLFNDDGDGSFDEERKVIKKWIEDNDVENVIIVTTEDDLSGMNYFNNDDHTEELNELLEEYNDINYVKLIINDYDIYKLCKNLIKNKTPYYKDKYDWEEIYIQENILSMKSMSNYIFFINIKYYKKLANTNK